MNGPNYTADNQDDPTQNDSQNDVSDTKSLSWRSVLKHEVVVSSGGLVGGSVLVGGVTANQGSLVSNVASDGHYALFPLGPDSGAGHRPRSKRDRTSRQTANANPTMTGLQDSTRRTVLKTLGAGGVRDPTIMRACYS